MRVLPKFLAMITKTTDNSPNATDKIFVTIVAYLSVISGLNGFTKSAITTVATALTFELIVLLKECIHSFFIYLDKYSSVVSFISALLYFTNH